MPARTQHTGRVCEGSGQSIHFAVAAGSELVAVERDWEECEGCQVLSRGRLGGPQS
jgi:hypothetical protein